MPIFKNKDSVFDRSMSPVDVRGGVFIEFAIIFPIFFLIVISFIEFSRYTSAKGVAETAAQRSLSLATVINGLDADDQTVASFVDAKEAVLEVARGLPRSTIFGSEQDGSSLYFTSGEDNPRLILPTPRPGETVAEAMRREPIEVEIDAQMAPFLPFFPSFSVRGRASGYREPYTNVSMPLPVDCVGNPKGSSDYYADCPCDGVGRVWNADQRECVCGEDFLTNEDETCRCRHSAELVDENGECYCPRTSDDDCPNNLVLEAERCYCMCPLGSLRRWDSETDYCYCDAERNLVDIGETRCGCIEDLDCGPNRTYSPTSCECFCNISRSQCEGGEYNYNACTCTCPEGMIHDAGAGRCVCDPATSPVCTAPEVLGADCSCGCPEGTIVFGDECRPPGCASEYCTMVSSTTCECRE